MRTGKRRRVSTEAVDGTPTKPTVDRLESSSNAVDVTSALATCAAPTPSKDHDRTTVSSHASETIHMDSEHAALMHNVPVCRNVFVKTILTATHRKDSDSLWFGHNGSHALARVRLCGMVRAPTPPDVTVSHRGIAETPAIGTPPVANGHHHHTNVFGLDDGTGVVMVQCDRRTALMDVEVPVEGSVVEVVGDVGTNRIVTVLGLAVHDDPLYGE